MSTKEKVRETSEKIKDLLVSIYDTYKAIYPEGKYLSMYICDGGIGFNNSYWDEDKVFPLDYYIRKEEE